MRPSGRIGGNLFTGIIEEVGTVQGVVRGKANRRLTVKAKKTPLELSVGDSVAVSGACLTAVEISPESFSADLAKETWERTSFSRLKTGSPVNLELPMRADARFGGHIVQGHVDGIGKVLALDAVPLANDYVLSIEIPRDLARYVVWKGSLCIEGISLTVAKVQGQRVSVAIIPHTVGMTNLKSLKVGDPVNLEVDVIAKYVEKMVTHGASDAITVERLTREGF